MKSYWKLLSLVKKYKKWLVLTVIAQVLMAFFTVISIPLLKPVLDLLFYPQQQEVLKPLEPLRMGNISGHLQYFFSQIIKDYSQERALFLVCLSLVLMFLMKNLFRYLGLFCLAPVRNGMVRDIRKAIYDKLLILPLSYYSEERKGDLISRITNDIQLVENSMIAMMIYTFREPFILIGALIYMLFVSPQLCLFVFGLMIVIILLIGSISRTLKKKSLRAQNQLGSLVSVIDESLEGMRVVKAYNAEGFVSGRFNALNEDYRRLLNRILWRRDLSSPLTEVLGIAVVSCLIWFGGRLVFNTNLDASTFMTFIMAFYFIMDPAKNFSSAYYNIQKGMGGLNRINEVMSAESDIVVKPDAPIVEKLNKSITFENVWFSYGKEEHWVLKDLNFEIPLGSCIALVGTSGAGKSTIADLLPRFYDVNKGAIKIDGKDIKDLDLKSIRALMGIVSQDPVLFNDTIKSNITLGEDFTDEEILAAAKAANAHRFISETENGYATIIGDRGTKLSGGQRQRISIARAILKNPQVLILDEATSALDSESENLVQEALDAVMSKRTTLVIAHRLSTIYKADEIIILEEGEIIERGRHEDLLKLGGKYRQFVDFQAFSTS